MTITATHLSDSSDLSVDASQAIHFRFPRGIHVTDPSGIHEAYDLVEAKKDYWVFTINVSAERIRSTFESLMREVDNPGYFIVEVSTRQEEEAKLHTTPSDPYHIDVHYLDGISRKRAMTIFDEYENLFVHDGRTQVGFGSHHGVDEVYVGPYKIFRIFTHTPEKYVAALNRMRYEREERLRTVWKTFAPRTPGRRDGLPDSPEVVGKMLARLQSRGLYFAERREELH